MPDRSPDLCSTAGRKPSQKVHVHLGTALKRTDLSFAVAYGMIRILGATAICLLSVMGANGQDKPIPVKVVIVTMFERGADSGDEPGELQYWVERNHLDRVLPFPQGFHDLRMNREGVLAVLTGVGTAKSAAAIMALGMDPRFDLSKAYWLGAGVAGVNPGRGSLGSAAWAEWVVDGDVARGSAG